MSAVAMHEPAREDVSASRPWLLVAVLMGCYLVSTLDRYAIGLLIEPISASLNLSDIEISLLIGIAFTVFFGTFGLLLGGFVDRYDRKRIIVIGVLVWTVATAATAFAHSYATLLICRIVVGVGEAALSPAAYSLIGDAFPRAKLSRPTTLYFLGGCLGPGVALVVGGLTLDWAEQLNAAHRLSLLHSEPWRFVMLAAAVPGLAAAAAVIAFIRDSRDPRALRAAEPRTVSSETLIDELRAKPLLYLGLLGGTGVVVAYFAGLAAWWPTHALRSFGWPLDRSGVYFGVLLAGGALIGVLAGGSISAALIRRFGDAGNGIALISLSIAAAIPMIGAPLIGIPELQLAGVAVAIAFTFAISSLAPVGCQLAAGPNMRGRVTALYAAITSIIGAGFGPFVVAWIAQLSVAGGAIGLGRAFAVVGLLCSVIMIAGYTLVVRQGRRKEIR